jgi:beta-N-acetylhexosaminidase
MKAIADNYGVEQAAVQAVRAGCDVLLVCSKPELADRAHAALVREAEADAEFHARCIEAAERSRSARRRFPCRQAPSLGAMHKAIDQSGASDLLADLAIHRARSVPPTSSSGTPG